jgi:hypothetical protein
MGAVPEGRTLALHADRLLAALLCGDLTMATSDEGALFDAACRHDIVPMLGHAIRSGAGRGFSGAGPTVERGFSRAFLTSLDAIAQEAAATDLAAEAELRRVLAALTRAGIQTLVIKGSHLAYTHYARPDLRARTDTDLLIARDQRERADHVLQHECGYRVHVKPSGDFTATQALYARTRVDGASHLIDLHWRLASPQLFAHVLSFGELEAASVPLAVLAPSARVPSAVHALVIACTHQVAHHHDEAEQFKWLYDVHLVASRFTNEEWDAFAALIVDRQVSAICVHGLERAHYWFHTEVPARVRQATLRPTATEATAAYLDAPSQAAAVLDDLRALPSWRDRLQLLREHLLPSADYMRRMYAPESAWPLPALYIIRVARGARRWLGFAR